MEQQLPPATALSWYEYVQGHLERLDWRGPKFEEETGIARTRLLDWRKGKSVSPEVARRLAEHFSRPVLEVFVAAGLLTAEEAGQPPGPFSPEDLSNEQLLGEVRRRLDATPDDRALTAEQIEQDTERYVEAGARGKSTEERPRRTQAK